MSELKTYKMVDEKYCTDCVCVIPSKVYLKSEADKVIEELKSDYKEACDRLQNANLIKDEQLAATRHQKYKRCLAMAKWCRLRARLLGACALYEKELWALKWHKRWLELAEKFKEAK